MRVAIIAALPGELKPLVKGWRRVQTSAKTVSMWVGGPGEEWVAVCAGMGGEAARRAFAEAEAGGRVDRVFSIGWAGALDEALPVGKSFLASAVLDAQTGERFELGREGRVLVSTARVADGSEKRRLAATYGGAMVDMESAAVVRMAMMRGIPVECVKGISDEAGARLPDFNRFIDLSGQMRMAAFVGYVAVRPRHWVALVRLGRASAAAAEEMASGVKAMLAGGVEKADSSASLRNDRQGSEA